MSIVYRPSVFDADPEELRAVYLARGWRGIEKTFGYSNAAIQQAKAILGGREAEAARASVQGRGRRAGVRS